MKRTNLLYIINILLLVFSFIVMATGVIKFPGLLQWLNVDPYSLPQGLFTDLHDWLGLAVVGLSLVHILLHWNWLRAMTKKLWKEQKELVAITIVLALLPLAFIRAQGSLPEQQADANAVGNETKLVPSVRSADDLDADLSQTAPVEPNHITIEDVGVFEFFPEQITAIRDDVFNPGHFSLFDILVHLDERGDIEFEYEYSQIHDTHLIRSINGVPNWWYVAFYDGGWPERNAWRMDQYPYKDRSVIRVSKVSERFLDFLYNTFEEEVSRREENNGRVIIPQIVIRTREARKLIFENVEITPHDLRTDLLKPGTITALDAIMTLGDMGEISYKLNWYPSVGSAAVVKNYFVDAINQDHTYDRCGFVYETGSKDFYGFDGNHIHIPSDSRVLTSPEYIEFFWICI